MNKKYSRRDFIKNASLASAAIPFGANDRVNFAVIGIRSRGANHIDSL